MVRRQLQHSTTASKAFEYCCEFPLPSFIALALHYCFCCTNVVRGINSIMAGIYPNLATAVRTISKAEGVAGFYAGWGPNLAQKIPSYGLTWVFFQQFKEAHKRCVVMIH
jgi:Mitochondrial carrier protein